MNAAVEHIHHGHRHYIGRKPADITVKRNPQRISRRPAYRHGNPQNRIGAELRFVISPIKLNHEVVYFPLLKCVQANDFRSYFIVYHADSFQYPLAPVTTFIAVSQFQRFMFAGGSAGRDNRTPGEPAP